MAFFKLHINVHATCFLSLFSDTRTKTLKDHQFTLVWPFFVVILGLGSTCRVFSRSVKTLAGCFVLFASCLTSDDILPLDIPAT